MALSSYYLSDAYGRTPVVCSRHRTPAIRVTDRKYGDAWVHCDACDRESERHNMELRALFEERFPSLSPRVAYALRRVFSRVGGGVAALLSASDADILAGRNIGPKTLVEFRAVWPRPTPVHERTETPPLHACCDTGLLALVGG